MENKVNKYIYWTPRILSIIFIAFLFLMSLDVFEESQGFWEVILGLFIHNIPALILLGILLISWKYEIVGGIGFMLGGIVYITMLIITAMKNGFASYYISWAIQISGISFLVGILFLVGWNKKKKTTIKRL